MEEKGEGLLVVVLGFMNKKGGGVNVFKFKSIFKIVINNYIFEDKSKNFKLFF